MFSKMSDIIDSSCFNACTRNGVVAVNVDGVASFQDFVIETFLCQLMFP